MWLCDSATSRFFLVPGWALPGGCGPAWLAAGCAWPWLAGAGPGRLGLALVGWGWPWLHTQHALTKLTPPLTSTRWNLDVCSQNSHSESTLVSSSRRLSSLFFFVLNSWHLLLVQVAPQGQPIDMPPSSADD